MALQPLAAPSIRVPHRKSLPSWLGSRANDTLRFQNFLRMVWAFQGVKQ